MVATGATARGDSSSSPDLVRLYLDEIGRYPLLTKAQEASLAQRMDTGRAARQRLDTSRLIALSTVAERVATEELIRQGEAAATEFVQSNLRLVVSVARRYRASEVALMDLIQDGNLGLMHAVEKFDWRRGFKFSTYATWWIRQSISRGVANTSRSIRLPVHAADLATSARRVRHEMIQRDGRTVTLAEMARELEVSETYLAVVLNTSGSPRSLSEILGDTRDLELSDLLGDTSAISPAQAAVDSAITSEVAILMGGLDNREREVLRLRFGLDCGDPCTLEQVGARFNLSRERIRQIERRALAKLRDPVIVERARGLLEG